MLVADLEQVDRDGLAKALGTALGEISDAARAEILSRIEWVDAIA